MEAGTFLAIDYLLPGTYHVYRNILVLTEKQKEACKLTCFPLPSKQVESKPQQNEEVRCDACIIHYKRGIARMSTSEQPGNSGMHLKGKGQPLLRHRAAEQERLRRLQQSANAGEHTLNEEEEYDDEWPSRLPTSTRRYNAPVDQTTWEYMQGNRKYIFHQGPPPVRRATQVTSRILHPNQVDDSEEARPRSRVHWLLVFGIGMLAMLALWTLGSVGVQWWNMTQDDWHYGRPRVYQTDAVVGHNDSPANPSHFIALNLNRHIIIIELQGADPSKAKIYTGPILLGDGQDLTSITLSFKDVNGDGLPDMLVHVQDQTFVMINDHGQFRPARQGERLIL